MNYFNILCRIGTTAATIFGYAACGSAVYVVAGLLAGPFGISARATTGASIGFSAGVIGSGSICDSTGHAMYMRGECKALSDSEMYVQFLNTDVARVKTLAGWNLMPPIYYERIGACQEGGYLK